MNRILLFMQERTGSAQDVIGKGDDTAHQWTSTLKRLGENLDGLIASSEEGFLNMGEKLKEFYQRAQEMCGKSSEMVETMTGEGLSEAIVGLSAILDELKRFMSIPEKSFSRTIDVLNEHLMTLKKVSSSLEDFNMLVMNLGMLGFLTQVENAHIFTNNTGFASLTEDVRSLAETIKQKSSQISTKSDTVLSFIAHARGKVADYKINQREQIHLMLEKAMTNHKSLTSKHSTTSGSARAIEQGTKKIASSIGDIVMSMQFHDITRQQVEHVKDVLESLCVRINEGGHTHEEVAAFVRDVCNLQHAQIRQSKDELTNAVVKIIHNLHTISTSVGEIQKVAEEVALASETGGVSFMEDIDAGISSIIECMRVSSDEQAKITNTVNSSSVMVSEMSAFVRDIETLGMKLQLIALNARIKAAHLGREGAVLDTISGGIYELSKNAREDTRHLSGMLADLVSLSSNFKKDYQGMQEGQTQAVDHVVEKLKRLIAFLQGIDKTVLAMLTDLSGLSDALMKDIEDVACNITVHKELQAKLEEVMDTILDVSEDAQNICPTGRLAATSSFLTDIDKLYTMESEREIHMMHADAHKQATIQERSNAPSDDLGDNVELF
ncbi:MAG: hypothetical protein ACLQDF_13290 [Desulfomonilia bacterium]